MLKYKLVRIVLLVFRKTLLCRLLVLGMVQIDVTLEVPLSAKKWAKNVEKTTCFQLCRLFKFQISVLFCVISNILPKV